MASVQQTEVFGYVEGGSGQPERFVPTHINGKPIQFQGPWGHLEERWAAKLKRHEPEPEEPEPRKLPADPASRARLFFGAYNGKTFDEIPLQYLDWLSGFEVTERVLWPDGYRTSTHYLAYGFVRRALTKYLTMPAIEAELRQLFPEAGRGGGSTNATFHNTSSQLSFMCEMDGGFDPSSTHDDHPGTAASRHREGERSKHRKDTERDIAIAYNRPRTRPDYVKAWETLADLLNKLESVEHAFYQDYTRRTPDEMPQPQELLEIDLAAVAQAARLIGPRNPAVIQAIREQYRRVRHALRQHRLSEPDFSQGSGHRAVEKYVRKSSRGGRVLRKHLPDDFTPEVNVF
jgi:hypothetical protein